MIRFNSSTHRWEIVFRGEVIATASFEVPEEELEYLRRYALRRIGVRW